MKEIKDTMKIKKNVYYIIPEGKSSNNLLG